MSIFSREDAVSPALVPAAPDRVATPLPAGFGLTLDPATVTFDGGTVLMGGSPLRLLRLSGRAKSVAERWEAGGSVGDGRNAQLLARRLVSSGTWLAKPGSATWTVDDVTVVIPVRDRPELLASLLDRVQGLTCVVVDDGSTDQGRHKEIADAAGATFVGLADNAGPAAARNAGLEASTTPLVAFVDSDCLPPGGWLPPLLGFFDDPLVAAVAPRIVPAPVTPRTLISRYDEVRSPLDLGDLPGPVRVQSRIPFVPSAVLVVRRAATTLPLFDPALRGGEDVDLVWRLHAAGWDVRYEPSCTVAHEGPRTLRQWLLRRAFYGSTAGPLSRRHPASLTPLHTSVWTAAVWGAALARRPWVAAAVMAASVAVLAQRLRGLVRAPVRVAARIAGAGTATSALPALGGLTRAWSPALVVGLLFRRSRKASAVALLAPALRDWVRRPGDLDPLRYGALHIADDVAYGCGVWFGCLRARTLLPLLPTITIRSRTWSSSTLRSQLRGDEAGGATSPTPE